MTSDAVFPLDDSRRRLAGMRLSQLTSHIDLGIAMTAAGPLACFSAMAGRTLIGPSDLDRRDQQIRGEQSSEKEAFKFHKLRQLTGRLQLDQLF